MIKEVLRKIQEGKTLAEISQEMNMEYSALMGLVEHLIKMGYLEAIDRKNEDILVCKACPLFDVCSKKGLKIYYLTEKGKRAAK